MPSINSAIEQNPIRELSKLNSDGLPGRSEHFETKDGTAFKQRHKAKPRSLEVGKVGLPPLARTTLDAA